MPRYSNTPIIQDNPRRYAQVKYPEIPLDFTDTYVYTTRGDRYDTLALTYYNDSSLWWVISTANPSLGCDSLVPQYGSQIRIPAFFRIATIISRYESLNSNISNEQLLINNR